MQHLAVAPVAALFFEISDPCDNGTPGLRGRLLAGGLYGLHDDMKARPVNGQVRQRHGRDELADFGFVDDAHVRVLLSEFGLEVWCGLFSLFGVWRRSGILRNNFFPALCILCYTHTAPFARRRVLGTPIPSRQRVLLSKVSRHRQWRLTSQ